MSEFWRLDNGIYLNKEKAGAGRTPIKHVVAGQIRLHGLGPVITT